MNQNEKWLLTAAKVAVFVPAAIVLVLGILTRLGWFAYNKAIAIKFTEIILAIAFYVPPLIGLIILLFSLLLWLQKEVKNLSSHLMCSLVYSVIALVSPVWLFMLWLFITGFNR